MRCDLSKQPLKIFPFPCSSLEFLIRVSFVVTLRRGGERERKEDEGSPDARWQAVCVVVVAAAAAVL